MSRYPRILSLLAGFSLVIAVGLLGPRVSASLVALSGGAAAAVRALGQADPSAAPGGVGGGDTADGASRTAETSMAASGTPGSGGSADPRATSLTPSSSPSQGPSWAPKRVVLGYYVPYDATSWASFQARATELDYVAGQWVTVDACGNLGSRDDLTLIAYATEHGVRVLPSLLTSSGPLNHQLLTDPATSDHFLDEIVNYVVETGYPGIDLDLEGIDAGDRDAYSAFVARVADALHRRGKMLTMAIPAKASDVRAGWAGPYDYAALGKHADLILLMTYDYSWSSGPPGSIAPQEWVDRVAAYAVSQMPAEKVLLGLAFYGYDWNKTLGGRARALLYSQSAALAEQRGTRIVTDEATRSGTFSYTAMAGDSAPTPPSLPALQHDIAVRTPGPCAVHPPSATPLPTATPGGRPPAPRPTPDPALPHEHVVWLEDAASAAARLEIAVRHQVGGVGAWRLGQEDPGVWEHLDGYRSGR